jgi:hypothetical protein
MKHLKTFESYNNELINENLFSYLFKNLSNNNDVKKGMEMVSDFFKKNPKELEDLKRKSAIEMSKFSEEEIEELSSKLTNLKDPIQHKPLNDAAEKVISELSESTVVSNAIKYLVQKLLDFIGASTRMLGLIMICIQPILGAIFLEMNINGSPFSYAPGVLIGLILGGITLIISGNRIKDYTQGKYDPRTNTTSPGSLDQFSGEHTMRYN